MRCLLPFLLTPVLSVAIACARGGSSNEPAEERNVDKADDAREVKTDDTTLPAAAKDKKTTEKKKTSVYGVWQIKCAKTGNSYFTRIYEYTVDRRKKTVQYFTDEKCEKLSSERVIEQTFKMGKSAWYTGIDGAVEVDMIYLSMEVAYYSESVIDSLNARAAWGYTDWQAGVPKGIEGRRYADDRSAEPYAGDMEFSILAIKDNKLLLGDPSTGDGKTELSRASDFDYLSLYSKTKSGN
jgi:hypothetical protein